MVKVSVIIPVHNSEKYLRECLDSVIAQDFLDIEFLCIDDDSTDQTAVILKEYAAADSRFRLIYDSNGSYGHKINRGISEAKGKYIGIVESDDMIVKEMYSTLYQYAEEHEVDYIKSDYFEFVTTPRDTYQTISSMLGDASLYGKVLDIASDPLITSQTAIAIWTGLYNREFLLKNQLYLNETPGASYQDTGFCYLTAVNASRAYYLNHAFYYYRTDNAGSSVKDERKSLAIVEEFKLTARNIPQSTKYNNAILTAFYIQKFMAYWWNIGRLSEQGCIFFVNTVKQDLLEDIQKKHIALTDLPVAPQKFFERLQDDPEDAVKEMKGKKRNSETMYKDIIKLLMSGKEIILFGAGKLGATVATLDKLLCTDSIRSICDNNSGLWGEQIFDQLVVSPQDAVEQYPKADYIIANKNYVSDIRIQLQNMNIQDKQIHVCNETARLITLLSYHEDIKKQG